MRVGVGFFLGGKAALTDCWVETSGEALDDLGGVGVDMVAERERLRDLRHA